MTEDDRELLVQCLKRDDALRARVEKLVAILHEDRSDADTLIELDNGIRELHRDFWPDSE